MKFSSIFWRTYPYGYIVMYWSLDGFLPSETPFRRCLDKLRHPWVNPVSEKATGIFVRFFTRKAGMK
jgi:hypothetical protein